MVLMNFSFKNLLLCILQLFFSQKIGKKRDEKEREKKKSRLIHKQ
jgi:hypothetical protein